jgi:Flp pilus assembly protein TadD
MKTLLNFTVSSLAIGTAFVCTSATDARPTMMTMAPAKAELGASKAADEARAAIGESRFETAVAQAELAVTLSPRSAEHRALLGQAYMKAGRFASAEQSFRDAITLDPAPGRTMLNLALAEIALGRKEAAQSTLAQARGAVADADYGLALALAGDTKGAVAVLEGAARAQGAGPKTRQNLALAYALDGRWREAQTVAAQDVPADELPARLAKWAQFAKPAQSNEQVASLLGVTPAADPGLPTRLALAPAAPEPVALAAAGPQVLPAPVEVPAPAAVAEARPTPASPAKPVMLVAAPKPKPAAPIRARRGSRWRGTGSAPARRRCKATARAAPASFRAAAGSIACRSAGSRRAQMLQAFAPGFRPPKGNASCAASPATRRCNGRPARCR